MQTTEALSDYERERGKPLPSKFHGFIQSNIILALAEYRPAYALLNELTLELDGEHRTPDVSIYASEDIDMTSEEVRVDIPPKIAVEIASPTQSDQDLADKARDLLQAGVESCWLVQPVLRTVTIFTEAGQRTFSEGTVADPVTGIELDVSDVFAGVGPQAS